MLTTARKIEIATAVMEDKKLGGTFYHMMHGAYTYGICKALPEEHFQLIYEEMRIFANRNLIDTGKTYWFATSSNKARTERIEFLKKYIEHLKQQENE